MMYEKAQKLGEKSYQVNHSRMILVTNPGGEWTGVLTPPYDAKIIAKDFMKFQKRG